MDNAVEVKKRLKEQERYSAADLGTIMELLRSPDGCPWDREQTHESIRRNFIEETYEVIEAIDTNDSALLREELGDVLLQVVFHAQLSKEEGNFDFDDVTTDICKKLIRRHPHVFGDVVADTSEKVLNNWDAIKKETKHQEKTSDVLKSVSKALPALMRAEKLGSKSKKAGFDFPDALSALAKLREEIDEAEAEIVSGNDEAVFEEFGDMLLACVNAARLSGVDSERALYFGNEKYVKRFEAMENFIVADGLKLEALTDDEKNSYWEKAKKITINNDK